MTRNEVMKTAALALEQLLVENQRLTQQLEKRAQVDHLVLAMIDRGKINKPGDVLTKVAEFEKQSSEDLKTLEKALELASDETKLEIKLGSVSEKPTADSMDPLTRMLFEE